MAAFDVWFPLQSGRREPTPLMSGCDPKRSLMTLDAELNKRHSRAASSSVATDRINRRAIYRSMVATGPTMGAGSLPTDAAGRRQTPFRTPD